MSSLHDLINRIQISNANKESYIYYDQSTGVIHKVSNKNVPSDEYAIIPIDSEEIKPILSGEKRTDEYIIVYDLSSKQVRLKEITYEDAHSTASTMCYQIPTFFKTETTAAESVEHDIIIQQDTNNNVWNIEFNVYTEKFLIRTKYARNETLYFSITEKHDPNILYRSLEFTIADLLLQKTITIPFIYDSEHNANNVSIYTAKYFESYAHEVI